MNFYEFFFPAEKTIPRQEYVNTEASPPPSSIFLSCNSICTERQFGPPQPRILSRKIKPQLQKQKPKSCVSALSSAIRFRYVPLGAPCLTEFQSYLLQLDSSKFHLRPCSLELKGKHIRLNHIRINQNGFAGKCSPVLALRDGAKQHWQEKPSFFSHFQMPSRFSESGIQHGLVVVGETTIHNSAKGGLCFPLFFKPGAITFHFRLKTCRLVVGRWGSWFQHVSLVPRQPQRWAVQVAAGLGVPLQPTFLGHEFCSPVYLMKTSG